MGPLTTDYRHGVKAVEVELLSIAVAIEYWVSACKRDTKPRPEWVKTGKNPADTLAKSLGVAFSDFVGGRVTKWAQLLWDRYTALKHDPSIEYDATELYNLMRGARVLMLCALTHSVSRSFKPVEMICGATQFGHLCEATKALVASNPALYKR